MAKLDNISDRAVFVAPSGGVTDGTPVKVEDLVVVPTEDADATESFVGVYRNHVIRGAPKPATEAWAVGEALYWDDSEKEFTTGTDTGTNKLAGIVVTAAAEADTTGDVELLGRPQV